MESWLHIMKLCSGSHIDAWPDGTVRPDVADNVGLQIPGDQASLGHYVHQRKVLGLVVTTRDPLEAGRHLVNMNSDW